MNAVSETEQWRSEDNLLIVDWLQNHSERGLKTSEQIITDEEQCEAG